MPHQIPPGVHISNTLLSLVSFTIPAFSVSPARFLSFSCALLTSSSLCSLSALMWFVIQKQELGFRLFVVRVFLQASLFSEKGGRNGVKSSWLHHAKQNQSKVNIPLFIFKQNTDALFKCIYLFNSIMTSALDLFLPFDVLRDISG